VTCQSGFVPGLFCNCMESCNEVVMKKENRKTESQKDSFMMEEIRVKNKTVSTHARLRGNTKIDEGLVLARRR